MLELLGTGLGVAKEVLGDGENGLLVTGVTLDIIKIRPSFFLSLYFSCIVNSLGFNYSHIIAS
jgi:hypothetical protein